MKKAIQVFLVAAMIAFVTWWAIPSQHEKVLSAYEKAQVGDSREEIHRRIGVPTQIEITQAGGLKKEGLVAESYAFQLSRYAFFYDAEGRLADKYLYTSE